MRKSRSRFIQCLENKNGKLRIIKELKARRSRCLTKEIEHKTAAIDDEISKLSTFIYEKQRMAS